MGKQQRDVLYLFLEVLIITKVTHLSRKSPMGVELMLGWFLCAENCGVLLSGNHFALLLVLELKLISSGFLYLATTVVRHHVLQLFCCEERWPLIS